VADWREYEEYIFGTFRKKFPGTDLQRDGRLPGQFSGVDRQIDIVIRGQLTGEHLLAIVDCKCFNTKVDVKDVEGFLGLAEDVRANLGIMITTQGYTEAAKRRANVRDIRLHVVDMAELEDYDFGWVSCDLCEPGEDHSPSMIYWNGGYPEGAERPAVTMGHCNWCNGISVKCHAGGTVTGVYEHDYNKVIECEGCGLRFRVKSEYIGDGEMEETIELPESAEE
jgi:hypothetical protein